MSFVSFVVQQYFPLNENAVFASEFHGYPCTFVWLCLRCWVARFNAPQGQQLIAQGTALGKRVSRCAPCKGKSECNEMIIKCFCPYRTQLPQYIQPRVIPWAISFWAFSPWICCSVSDAPFIYKGDLSSTTIISFVSTTNLTKDTNYFVGINEFIVLFSWFVSFVSFVVKK